MIGVYGIKNCNTMKKCFDYLAECGVNHEFFDYKKQVLTQADFVSFVGYFGLDKLINKQGTTYRKLNDHAKALIASGDVAAIYELVKTHQSLLKRPVVVGEFAQQPVRLIGFCQADYEQIFGASKS